MSITGGTGPLGQPATGGNADDGLISRIFDVISEFRPLYETATAISSLMCDRLGYSSSAILLRRDDGDFLEIEGAAGLSNSYVQAVNSGFPIRIQDPMLSEGPTSEAYRTGTPVVVFDTETDERFRRWRDLARQQNYRSLISVPMSVHDNIIGTLNCYHREPYSFPEDEVRTLMTIATQIGLAIEIARMVHQQQRTITRLNELTEELDRQRSLLERSEEIHERLTRLVLTNQGIPAIAMALSAIVDGAVFVQDSFFQLITSAIPDGWHGDPVMPLRHDRTFEDVRLAVRRRVVTPVEIVPHDESDQAWVSAPVIAGREVLGYVSVSVSSVPAPSITHRAVGHAATVIALEMTRERLTHEMDVRDRRTFTDDLLAGRFDDANLMRARGRYLGYDLREPFQVIIFDAAEIRRSGDGDDQPAAARKSLRHRFFDVMVQLARDRAPHLLVSGREDQLAVVVTGAGKEAVHDVDRIVRARLERALPDLRILAGVGRLAGDLMEIPNSHREAGQALSVIDRLGGARQTLWFDDLGVTGILFQVSNPADLLAFARSQLAPVLEYDREQNGILLEALGGYFEWGPSITTVADQLDLHPNTVRYRLRKAESLLGISLRNQSDLLDLHLAYRVIQLTQPADVLSAS